MKKIITILLLTAIMATTPVIFAKAAVPEMAISEEQKITEDENSGLLAPLWEILRSIGDALKRSWISTVILIITGGISLWAYIRRKRLMMIWEDSQI